LLIPEIPAKMEYGSFLANNPKHWEVKGVTSIIELLKTIQCRTHITNVSSAPAAYEIYNNKTELPHMTFDNAAAFIYFSDDMINPGDTRFKTNPPIREERNKKLLMELLCM
jgi:dihydroorotase-like cyclic amidohydrolase